MANSLNWETNCQNGQSVCTNPAPNDYPQQHQNHNDFDDFMAMVKKYNQRAVIIANTESDTPAHVAALVTHAAQGGDLPYIQMFELGNEIYIHSPNNDPHYYGNNIPQYAQAMQQAAQAAGMSIHIAVNVWDGYGYGSEGDTGGWADQFSQYALSMTCNIAMVDAIESHPYVGGAGTSQDSGLLQEPSNPYGGVRTTINREIGDESACPAKAGKMLIDVGEINSDGASADPQTASLVDGLYAADSAAYMAEFGATTFHWFDLHNGRDATQPYIAGNYYNSTVSTRITGAYEPGRDFGDWGVLENCVSPTASYCMEEGVNYAFPTYYGLKAAAMIYKNGGSMLKVSSDTATLDAHAVREVDGSLALLLINKSPSADASINVSISGYSLPSSATVYSYGPNQSAIGPAHWDNAAADLQQSTVQTSGPGGASIAVPAYSVAVVKFASAPNLATNPGFETGTFSGWDSFSTSSVVAANAHSGTYAAQFGSGGLAQQWVTGLSPNTTYTVSGWVRSDTAGSPMCVGAKDFGGTETNSCPSSMSYTQPSVTFTTGSGNTAATIYLYKPSGTSGTSWSDDVLLVQK